MKEKINKEIIKTNLNNVCSRDNIYIYEDIASTNITAKELAEHSNAPHGTIVLAEQQSAGKGRLGRSFYSPNSTGIYMSVILRLEQNMQTSLRITSAAAVAVCHAVKVIYNINTEIKWVNDVYLNGKKICGILTEASINPTAQKINYVIVGIGINICTDSFPDDLGKTACSLFTTDEYSKQPPRELLIAEVANQLDSACNTLSKNAFIDEYKRLSFIIGSDVNVIMPNKPAYRAKAISINNDGHLIVQQDDGTISELSSGEISIRKI